MGVGRGSKMAFGQPEGDRVPANQHPLGEDAFAEVFGNDGGR